MNSAYLNSTVFAALRPSPIHGVGVFAIRDIPEGTEITDFQSPREQVPFWLAGYQLEVLDPAIKGLVLDQTLSFTEDAIKVVSPNAVVILRSFMNHSREPNTDGIEALRDIKAGEELTEDYTKAGPLSSISKEHYDSFL